MRKGPCITVRSLDSAACFRSIGQLWRREPPDEDTERGRLPGGLHGGHKSFSILSDASRASWRSVTTPMALPWQGHRDGDVWVT